MKPDRTTSQEAIQNSRKLIEKMEKILDMAHIKIPEKTRKNPERESAIFGQTYIELLSFFSKIFDFWFKIKRS